MRSDAGPVPIEDLRRHGVLLEINRRVLHPVGLSLYVDGRTGGMYIVRDNTTGGGGVLFAGTVPGVAEKAERFREMECAEHMARYLSLGFIVEPLGDEPPRVVAADGLDGVTVWPFVESVVAALTAALPFTGDDLRAVVDAVASAFPSAVLAPLLSRLELQSTDGGATWQWRIGEDTSTTETGPLQRCIFLCDEIERLQNGGESSIGNPSDAILEYVQRARGQLYPDEVAEFSAARSVVLSDDPSQEQVESAHAALERLYCLAQPGMRILRGDADARDEFEGHRVGLRDAARAAADRMTAYERLVAGELGDYDVAPWADLQVQVERDLEMATEACAEADRQLREATQAQERAQRCLAVVGRARARVER